jgi:hypothetical protein
VFCKYLALCLCIVCVYFCVYFLHSTFERIMYVQTCTRRCVRTHLRVFDHSAPSHTHYPARMRSNLLTYVHVSKFKRMTHLTHMHPARVRLNVPMYVRTHSFLGLT